ncbi:MAG: glycosyltransferase family 4 protein, partial [Pseudomonadota bacterium]
LFAAREARGMASTVVLPADHADQLHGGLALAPFDRSKRGFAGLVRMVRAMFAAKRQSRPDVIFFHSTFSLLGLLALKVTGDRTPCFYCSHGWAYSRYKPGTRKARLAQIIEGRLCGLAEVVINISMADQRLAMRLGYRGRHQLIENAVLDAANPGLRARFPKDRLNLLFVGRLDKQKGIDLLLEAAAKAHETRPDLALHVVGAAVNNDADGPASYSFVTQHGWLADGEIDAFYRSADALVVPSRWEGFGMVVPEALRNGTPVLVSTAGALPDLVDDGKTGFVFELAAGELVELLQRLDKAELAAMRPACRESYEGRFTVRRYMSEFRDLVDRTTLPGEESVEETSPATG